MRINITKLGWLELPLEEICSQIVGGGTPSTKVMQYWQGSIPWITSADILDTKTVLPKKYITQEAIKNSATNIVPKHTIIVVTRVGLGKIGIAPVDLCFSQDNQGLIFYNNIVDTNYALFYLSKAVVCFKQSGRGTTINGVTKDQLRNLVFKLPPLPEQRAIVTKIESLFSELDNGIESLKKAQEQLKVYRQAVLKWAFEGKLTNENVKEGELPKGWELKKISDISNVVRGGSPRPAGDPQFYNGNIPFLKVADLTKDNSVYLNEYEYTIKEAGLHKTRKIEPETLLLTNSGATLGVPKICKIHATMNDGIAAFLGLDNKSLLYLYYFWLSKTKELRTINQGAAQPNLNTEIIKNYEVPLCSLAEQHQIVEAIETRLSVCDKLEETISQSLQQAEALRQSILKKAFEGKLLTEAELQEVRKAPDWEPAEKLLERIKAERSNIQPQTKSREKREKR